MTTDTLLSASQFKPFPTQVTVVDFGLATAEGTLLDGGTGQASDGDGEY